VLRDRSCLADKPQSAAIPFALSGESSAGKRMKEPPGNLLNSACIANQWRYDAHAGGGCGRSRMVVIRDVDLLISRDINLLQQLRQGDL
jgi:hypothetical protein